VASANNVSDAEAPPDLLEDAPGEIEQVSGRRLRSAETLRHAQQGRRQDRHPITQGRKDLAARKQEG